MSGEPRVIAEAHGHRVFDNGEYETTETYALWSPATVTALMADLERRMREDLETLESFRKEDTDSVVGLANRYVALGDRVEALEELAANEEYERLRQRVEALEKAPRPVVIDPVKAIDPSRSVRTSVRREHSDGRPATPADEVPRVPRGDRGFLNYGMAPIGLQACPESIEVYESSGAGRPKAWLRVFTEGVPGQGCTVALTVQDATELGDRLQAWLDDHPEGDAA